MDNIRPRQPLHRKEMKDICSAHTPSTETHTRTDCNLEMEWRNSKLDARTAGSKKKKTHDWNTTPEPYTRKATQRSTNRRVEYYAIRDRAGRAPSAAGEQSTNMSTHATYQLRRRRNCTADALVAPWLRFEIPDLPDVNEKRHGSWVQTILSQIRKTDVNNTMQTSRRPPTCNQPRRF